MTTAQANESGGEDPRAFVERLRAEQAAHPDRAMHAILLYECGALEESTGEEPVAARDYLAAFNVDPTFREPLEALVRILSRRKSIKNLGKLLEALVRAAATPEERARAYVERAAYLEDHEQDAASARECLDEAVSASPEDPLPWIELERLAAREGDVEGRMRAIEARAQLAHDPTWKALLYIELAELAGEAGLPERAYELLDAASALDGTARFRTRQALEALAKRQGDEGEIVRALEGQADLVAEALEDPAQGDATGVPRARRTAAFAADAWLRAAGLRARAGERDAASTLLERALSALPGSALLLRARIAALESSGEIAAAADLARAELARGATGPGAASLWLRVAEAARAAGDADGVRSALASALEADPASIPARALWLDCLADEPDRAAFARELQASAEGLATAEARARALLVAAYVWAAEAREPEAARGALAKAVSSGLGGETAARVARSLAAIASDAAWYEAATAALVGTAADDERASLWFELGRARLARGDGAGASEAFEKLGQSGESGAWLGRALGAFAVAVARGGAPSAEAIDGLAAVEADPELASALRLVAALRAAQAGDAGGARRRLARLHEAEPRDEVVALFLAELARDAGDVAGAAATLSACAAASDDAELGAALHLEAAILLWRAGERVGALAAMEAAQAGAPRAAATVLGWALWGHGASTIDGRRRALTAALDAGADVAATSLARFGLEVAAGGDGDPLDAVASLEAVEREASGDLAVAGALARLLHPSARDERAAVDRALDVLEDAGGAGVAVARAERFRVARVLEQDRALAVTRAAEWADADPSAPAALEWLAAALAADDREAEVAARRTLARALPEPARSSLEVSAAVVAWLDAAGMPQPFVGGEGPAPSLMNLELALPGCDPRRRAAALRGLDGALGDDAGLDALGLAGWSDLAAGRVADAAAAFRDVVEVRTTDLAAWEGLRTAGELLGDRDLEATATEQLGELCADDARGAELWEKAGLLWIDRKGADERAIAAFEQAFHRDPRRAVAFDKLFRFARSTGKDDALLTIIASRLDVAEEEAEIAKLFWERARVLRKKGDREAALAALEDVAMLEPDHVGALALAGEIQITKGAFDKAAPLLARLATIDAAPPQQRLMSGIAAVDLYEKKLGDAAKALEVLVGLHNAGLATLPVRERLAALAARSGAYHEATSILEVLMRERDKPEGRIEAARLAMAIYRDKLCEPARADRAVAKLLDEAPDDGEAIDLVLATPYEAAFRTRALGRAKATLLSRLAADPCDVPRVALLAKIAGSGQDLPLRQATLGALLALGRKDTGLGDELRRLDGRVAALPEIRLDERALAEISDPDDAGPVAELFAMMADTIGLALGPSLVSLGVTKKERIDSRGGHPLRLAVASWMGAVGFDADFDLYVGGRDPRGVSGVAGEQPAIVLGSAIATPLDAAARSAIAREVFALRRGITAVRTRDDNTLTSIVIASCVEAGLQASAPPFAVYGEVARAIHKEIPRRVRKAIPEVCQRIQSSRADASAWATAARRSIDRMAVVAAGDVSIVLKDVLGVPDDRLGEATVESERARRLLGFVLSPSYLDLRRKLGMGVR
jgi:tetratricopeptide (TPR) repeat protein